MNKPHTTIYDVIQKKGINMSFADLKRSSNANFEKLNKELSRLNSNNKSYGDDRYWQPTVDQQGNGSAVIRFLPSPNGEDFPFVRMFTHGFKGPTGAWYIENSLTTLEKDDPVSDFNTKLWNSTTDDDSAERKQARDQKRKLNYISNIYVVEDPGNRETEGKVFLYKYGKKIFDKLNELMNPSFEDEEPIDPFDLWKGANFKLRITKEKGFRSYDKSKFEEPSALSSDDDELERIYNQEYSLQDEVDPKNFKSYEELQTKLNKVLGIEAGSSIKEAVRETREEIKETPQPEHKESKLPSVDTSEDDDDDEEDWFASIRDED